LSDIGFLVSIVDLNFADILTDQKFTFKDALTENYIANQLQANDIELFYWRNQNRAEVDFLMQTTLATDGIVPVEVKADKRVQFPSLRLYMQKYHPSYATRISSKNFGRQPFD
jgi:predicted AAA+ superfamily ATPase